MRVASVPGSSGSSLSWPPTAACCWVRALLLAAALRVNPSSCLLRLLLQVHAVPAARLRLFVAPASALPVTLSYCLLRLRLQVHAVPATHLRVPVASREHLYLAPTACVLMGLWSDFLMGMCSGAQAMTTAWCASAAPCSGDRQRTLHAGLAALGVRELLVVVWSRCHAARRDLKPETSQEL